MKKHCFCAIIVFSVTFLPAVTASAQSAKLQIVHNSPDAAADTVDIYVGDELKADNLTFRSATAFSDVSAGVELSVGIAGPGSSGSGDALVSFPVAALGADTAYVLVVTGVLDPDAFAANPEGISTALQLLKFAARLTNTSGLPGFVELAFVHGAPDAPSVDAVANTGPNVVTDLGYTDVTPYQALPAGEYQIDLRPTGTQIVAAQFEADLRGLADGAAIVIASGFLDPSANNDGPAFGALVVLPNGLTMLLEPPSGVGVEEIDLSVPEAFELGNNYPNPFNPTTTFEYTVPATEHIRINVYDVSGRLVQTLVDQVQTPATYRATFDAAGLSSGIYLYQLRAGSSVITKKMLLIK